jgi:hypothetical protein
VHNHSVWGWKKQYLWQGYRHATEGAEMSDQIGPRAVVGNAGHFHVPPGRVDMIVGFAMLD